MVQNRLNSFYGMPQAANYPNMAQFQQQSFNQPYGIAFVYGEEGAKAYMVSPGFTMYLIDKESDRMFVKGTDVNGNLLPIETYRIVKEEKTETVKTQNDYPTREEFNTLNEKVDKLYSALKQKASYTKSEKGGHE